MDNSAKFALAALFLIFAWLACILNVPGKWDTFDIAAIFLVMGAIFVPVLD